jgi:hypothetical protein
MSQMLIKGDANVPDMPLTDSEVNHMRRLLAWMRCQWMLDEHMQAGMLQGLQDAVQHGASEAAVNEIVAKRVEQINQVPLYVRQALKMLTKALRDHERRSGVVDSEV